MWTTREQIRQWLIHGQALNATHVIIACDTFDHEDYPIYVQSTDNINEKIKEYDWKNMQKIMEVYNLSMDIEVQLAEQRVWNV